jgi:hypothetical protein
MIPLRANGAGQQIQPGRHGEARRRYSTYHQRMHEITVTPQPWLS